MTPSTALRHNEGYHPPRLLQIHPPCASAPGLAAPRLAHSHGHFHLSILQDWARTPHSITASITTGAGSSVKKEYGYRGGKLLVVWDGDKSGDERLKWLVQDHLGSTRMEADKSGSLSAMKRHDYAPFGEEMTAGIRQSGGVGQYGYEPPQTNVRQRFTGYERDDETELDFAEARYYANLQGRFISSDPLIASARRRTPQSWNRYSYGINNPLKYTDPTGEAWVGGPGKSIFWDPGVSNADEIVKKYGEGYSLLDGQTIVVHSSENSGFKEGHLYTLNKDGSTTWHGIYLPLPPVAFSTRYGDQMALEMLKLYGQAAMAAITGGGSLVGAAAGAAGIIADNALDEEAPDPQTIAIAGTVGGPFSIIDWNGYPSGLPKPEGPFTLMGKGDPAYEEARRAADAANKRLRGQLGNAASGMEVHEIHPVQFGGHPTSTHNKAVIPASKHKQYSRWWRALARALRKGR